MNDSDKVNPSQVDKIVDELIEGMSLRERNVIADLTEMQLLPLQLTLTKYISEKLQSRSVKKEILEDCVKVSNDENLGEKEERMKRVWRGIGSIVSMFFLCNSFVVTELERTGESTLAQERRSYER